jgi:AraC-like DNA-binding protein
MYAGESLTTAKITLTRQIVILHFMQSTVDLVALASREAFSLEAYVPLQDRVQEIPGSIQYSIKRYRKQPDWDLEDLGMVVYHYEKKKPSERYLELRFCVSGNVYCREKDKECNRCQFAASPSCLERVESVDLVSFRFSPTQLRQFVKAKKTDSLHDNILQFKHGASFVKTHPICPKTSHVLDSILNNNYNDTRENIFINAQTQMLLLYTMDCMIGEQSTDIANCKFLANEADREKITQAREILIKHIGEPITIKELSRKVAINECYLKKGFKELFGTTVFEFYQSQRMEHAKFLLYEKGLTVTEVSMQLGYSSISHFSTAFKKHTGCKPCELLR